MAAIVYLDVDDEITSAAARIRSADETRIALVVPNGSRLGTSRINFRLLAREAQARGRTLAIVTPDAATRALAGSAGLDTFGAVTEYEATASGSQVPDATTDRASGAAMSGEPAPGTPARRRRPRAPADDGPAVAGLFDESIDASAPTVVIATPTPAAAPAMAGATASGSAVRAKAGTTASAPTTLRVAEPASRAPKLPVVRGLPRRIEFQRTSLVIGVTALGIAFLAVGVGAFLLLPTASITLAPRVEPIGPVEMTIRADPDVSAPDPTRGVIPAQRLTFPVAASGEFPATGSRVEEDPAVGEVTFENYDPTDRNVVPAGSVVSTEGGVRFRTTAAVSVPAGTFVLPEVVPGRATIGIEAVHPGPDGNVPANAITIVPEREDPIFLRVRNEAPTTGGARREFRRVSRADVARAQEAIAVQLADAFAAILVDPSRVPPETTLFPETQELGEPVPTGDPTALVGQETETFELAVQATGTVVAVDQRPVTQVADARIRGEVAADHELVEGSIVLDPGEPSVIGGEVRFPVTARASQARIIDPAALLREIKGKPIPQARSYLESFGEVAISTWPEWVTSIPTLDLRLSLTVEQPPQPSPVPSALLSPETLRAAS
jgi:hypothetical protein